MAGHLLYERENGGVMKAARIGSTVLAMVLAAACSTGGPATDREETRASESALSFPSGNNDGYCASNPSQECFHGAPVAAKKVVLTFDDGPGSQTLALSSWLAAQGVRATFFVNGKNFGASPGAVLSQLVADGHLVGNHTQDHLDLTTLGDSAIVNQLAATDAIIGPYVAGGHLVFRAPYGAWSAHDYAVLHASAMDKYVGPVSWDVGGAMTSSYAADWDCWQNTNGYGVMTSKQCGDRYLREITDVGRGIVLMHDADYGNSSNHNLTSGQGNTVDMVKYMVPILKQQGYSFLRLDEVPDIAAAFPGGGGGADAGADATDATDAGGGTCAFDPTWQQTSYANEWWIEYAISGSVTSASLEVVGGATTTLSKSYDKWVGSPASRIAAGTPVVVHAKTSANQSAQTQPFGFLVTTSPVTACGAPPPDAGTCSALAPTWSQGSGANNWWVEYAIASSTTIASAYLEVVGGQTVPLSLQWNKWLGPASAQIGTGASVIVHAEDTLGQRAQTSPFGYLSVSNPQTQPCAN
jgi:peptidoglycan-N-acetylglucosamine deacetylase